MKKLFGAIILGTMIFGAVFASASVLPMVNGTGTLQSTDNFSVSCQNTPLKLTYHTLITGTGVNSVLNAVLSNIDASCVGNQALVQLLKTATGPYSSTSIWYSWATITAAGSITLPFAPGDTFGNTAYPPVADVNFANVMFSSQP